MHSLPVPVTAPLMLPNVVMKSLMRHACRVARSMMRGAAPVTASASAATVLASSARRASDALPVACQTLSTMACFSRAAPACFLASSLASLAACATPRRKMLCAQSSFASSSFSPLPSLFALAVRMHIASAKTPNHAAKRRAPSIPPPIFEQDCRKSGDAAALATPHAENLANRRAHKSCNTLSARDLGGRHGHHSPAPPFSCAHARAAASAPHLVSASMAPRSAPPFPARHALRAALPEAFSGRRSGAAAVSLASCRPPVSLSRSCCGAAACHMLPPSLCRHAHGRRQPGGETGRGQLGMGEASRAPCAALRQRVRPLTPLCAAPRARMRIRFCLGPMRKLVDAQKVVDRDDGAAAAVACAASAGSPRRRSGEWRQGTRQVHRRCVAGALRHTNRTNLATLAAKHANNGQWTNALKHTSRASL
ncbi:hypothetical protein, conserved in T. vivax [Trypanosoma vivax Y486]|uniref:Uncharacterized protein n=1 Tax=Trypanosoma vivax (strain Y486) TaxID=1055687 RepID=F9WLL6_TRYVY|nr:hypothetical protein, conserved in T. vivax [Trypanosoma vivax Y486]|eukprot:CCD18408.1 hypothetical protein, conserved in T. vivax [Trypanosoma vivax Y486]